jgi:hypothetical protein
LRAARHPWYRVSVTSPTLCAKCLVNEFTNSIRLSQGLPPHPPERPDVHRLRGGIPMSERASESMSPIVGSKPRTGVDR